MRQRHRARPSKSRSSEVSGDVERVVSIERLVPGGRGFSRTSDGKPVFVEGALPGDRVELVDFHDRGSYREAKVRGFVARGPEQVSPRCVHVDACGGCDWMRLAPERQRLEKRRLLEEALVRTGRFDREHLPLAAEVGCASSGAGYRMRARLQLRSGKIGFFARGSHDVVEVDPCRVLTDEVAALLVRVRRVIAEQPSAFRDVDFLELRVLPTPTDEAAPKRSSVFVGVRAGGVFSAGKALERLREHAVVRVAGDSETYEQRYFVTDDTFVSLPVGGFCQVNHDVNRRLVERVLGEAALTGGSSFLDLYSGAGNFALPLARSGRRGLAIEIAPEAVQAGLRAAREQSLPVEFRSGDVARAARELARAGERYDFVVLDPPRAGARDALEAVLELATKKIVVIACDPVTLARDLEFLVRRGARLDRVEAWDMFPETHHVETLAVLSIGDARPELAR